MPTNRTARHRPTRRRIDAQTVAIWQIICEINASPRDRDEPEPIGRNAEFWSLNRELCQRLGHWFWYMNMPIFCAETDPPDWMLHNPQRAANWRVAYRWRVLLIEAAQRATMPKPARAVSPAGPAKPRSVRLASQRAAVSVSWTKQP